MSLSNMQEAKVDSLDFQSVRCYLQIEFKSFLSNLKKIQ